MILKKRVSHNGIWFYLLIIYLAINVLAYCGLAIYTVNYNVNNDKKVAAVSINEVSEDNIRFRFFDKGYKINTATLDKEKLKSAADFVTPRIFKLTEKILYDVFENFPLS